MRQGTRKSTWLSEIENFSEEALIYILSKKDDELIDLKSMVAVANNTTQIQKSREFKNSQKLSIPSFIEREIIHRALFQLEKDKKVTVKKLAKKLGFRTTKDFEITFEKYLLIKPSRYKELVKMRANHFYQKDLLHCHCSFL